MRTQITLTPAEAQALLELVRKKVETSSYWIDSPSQDEDLQKWHVKNYQSWRKLKDKLERAQ